MFSSITTWFSENWKKILAGVGAAFLSFLLLKFVIAPLLSLTVACVLASLGVGYLVFSKVALWEIQRVIDKTKNIVR